MDTEIPRVIDFPKCKRKPRTIKPPAVRTAVTVKRANGDSITKIARDLDISRPTVYSIIKESGIDELCSSGVLGCANLIRKAVSVVDKRLDKGSETAAFGILNPLVLRPNEDKGSSTTNITYNFAIMQGRKDAP